jgi:uroporphyrinogen decarboxylase
MSYSSLFRKPFTPNWEGFLQCITRQGQPARVHNIELFLDGEVKDTVCARFGVAAKLDPNDPWYGQKREIAIQRFLGYDYVVAGPEGLEMPIHHVVAEDTAEMKRSGGRSFVDQHTGPITSWNEFEHYPWPDVSKATTRVLEWYEKNLPDDMCLIGGLTGHFAENLSWLMGYETLCYKLYDEPELVRAVYERSLAMDSAVTRLLTQFERVKVIWGSDDMGYRSGTLISPKAMRQYVLPGHKVLAQIAHNAGRAYILHSCGNLDAIMKDLIEDVKIDGKHSYEDVITPPQEAKVRWGSSISILGGLDMDFICRADEAAVRQRTRQILDACQPGGGYCLGTGNTVANYIPLDHYLAMLDEGRNWA